MPSIYRIGIHFYIREDRINASGNANIYLLLTHNNQKLRISTNHAVKVKKWDASNQKIIGTNEAAKSINNSLDLMKARIVDATNTLSMNNKPLSLTVIKDIISDKVTKADKTLLYALEKHNEEMKSLINIKYGYKSYQAYSTTKGFIATFLKEQYKKNDILLSDIDLTFAKNFETWILRNTKSTNNGMAKHIQRLKKIIHWSIKEGWIGASPIHTFRVNFHRHERGFLSNEEINLLEEAVPEHKTLIGVRELFLFQIYTGLAYSDLTTLEWGHIQYNHEGQDWIIKPRDKTNVLTTVPLIHKAKAILDKRKQVRQEGLIFHVYANQPYNRYLKLLAQEIGLKKRLTSHLGRHTFATTITLSNGIPIETVSKMLGHTMISTTQIYSKVTIGKIATDMSKLK